MTHLSYTRNFNGATRYEYFSSSLANFCLQIMATIIIDTPALQASFLVQVAAQRR
jgi:hypothetical protein